MQFPKWTHIVALCVVLGLDDIAADLINVRCDRGLCAMFHIAGYYGHGVSIY